MKPPLNIKRLDNDAKKDHGWIVTLQRKGAIIVKRFSDGTYGGKRVALEAAVEYRDSFLARDKPLDHQIWIRTRLRKNNKSGIPGVLRYEITGNPNTGNVRVYWIAAWTNEHGMTRQRKFSVARYGEEEARLLAIAERDFQLRRVCAINVAARAAEPPDRERVWKASRTGRDRDRTGRERIRTRKTRPRSKPRRVVDSERGGKEKARTIELEATVDRHGRVTLLEPVKLTSTRRALVTIFCEAEEHKRGER